MPKSKRQKFDSLMMKAIALSPEKRPERISEESGLDLLVVSLETSPPVVRLVDYGKYKYELEKKQREAKKKQHTVSVKEIKMGVRIDDNDYQVKVNRAASFLDHGDKVKLTIRLKGREMQHTGLAFDLANRFVLALEDHGLVDGRVRQEGRTFVAHLSPKPATAKKKDKPEEKKEASSDAKDENA